VRKGYTLERERSLGRNGMRWGAMDVELGGACLLLWILVGGKQRKGALLVEGKN